MTYEEIVNIVRDNLENADAREIFEHIAFQFNITGEGSGAFYIEVAERSVCVEPYDYYDRDGLITGSAEAIINISAGKIGITESIEKGLIYYEGNPDKLVAFRKIKLPKKKVSRAKKNNILSGTCG